MSFVVPENLARAVSRAHVIRLLPLAMVAALLAVVGASTAVGAAAISKTYDCGGGYQVNPTTVTLDNAPAAMYVNETSTQAQGKLSMKFPANAELDLTYYTRPFTIPEGQPLAGTTFDVPVRWLQVGGATIPGSFGGKSTGLIFSFPKEEMTRQWSWEVWRDVSDGWTWTSNPVSVPLTAPATPGDYPVTFGDFNLPLAESGTLKILGITVQEEVPLGTETWHCTGAGMTFPAITVKSRSHVSLALNPAVVQQGSATSVQGQVTVDGGAATGRVEYFEVVDGAPGPVLASVNVVAGDVPSVALPVLPAGEHEIGARFVPVDQVHYDPSTAVETQILTVKAPNETTTSLTVDPLEFLNTDSTTATVQVTSAVGTPAGQVIFTIDGVDRPAMALGATGTASLSISGLSVGTHPIKVRFVPADANLHHPSESIERTMVVTKLPDPSATTVTVSPNPALATDTVTATANVSITGGAPANGTVTWTVIGTNGGNTYFDNTSSSVVGPDGRAALDLSALGYGTFDISADFTPDANAAQVASTSNTVSLQVNRPPATTTTTELSLSETLVYNDQSVTATARVRPASPQPRGDVVFTVDGVDREPVPWTGSPLEVTLGNLANGQHKVSVRFVAADALVFTDSAAPEQSFFVQDRPPVATATTLAVSPATILDTESTTATAKVSTSGLGQPLGAVEFRVTTGSRTELWTRNLTSSGADESTASLSLDGLAPGSYSIVARYVHAADTRFVDSDSAVQPLQVDAAPPAASATSLALSHTTVTYGETVRATATVVTGRGVGAGHVRFEWANTSTTASLDARGAASVDLTGLAVGTVGVRAVFVPADAGRQTASTSATRSVEVEPLPETASLTTVQLSRSTMPTNGSTVLTAQVTTVSGTPQGVVEFLLDGAVVGSTPLGADQQAAYTLADLPATAVGDHVVKARFVPAAGSTTTGSTSAGQPLEVVEPAGATPSTSVLSISRSSVPRGETFVATVTTTALGLPVQGQVELAYGDQAASVDVDADGVAVHEFTGSRVGTSEVTARFVSSSPDVADSLAPAMAVTVSDPAAAVSATTLRSSTDEIAADGVLELTATVRSTGPVAGTVRFTEGGTEVTTAPVDPDTGTATAQVAGLSVGTHAIVAEFLPADATAVQGSRSGEVTVAVVPGSAVNLTLDRSTVVEGSPVNAVADVTAAGGPADGTVTFAVGGQSVTAVVVDGAASTPLPVVAAGTYEVDATFAPTDPAMRGSSATASLVVTPSSSPTGPPPTPLASGLAITAMPDVAYGAADRVTATVRPDARGTVQFIIGSFRQDVPVVSGSATVALPRTVAVGNQSLSASFVPSDPKEFAPARATASFRVVKDATKISFKKRYFTDERVFQVRGLVKGRVGRSIGTGKVRFVMFRGRKKVKAITLTLDCNGYAEVRLPVTARDTYKVKVTYKGSDNLLPAKKTLTKKIGHVR